jgi:hypothetical protein
MTKTFAATAATVVLGLAACGSGDDSAKGSTTAAGQAQAAATPFTPRFDGKRAMSLVKLQVGYGQRPAGSPQLRKLAQRLRTLLPNAKFEPIPGHEGLRNVVGRIPGAKPAIVLGAHYDSESHPKGFVGANDSAAGTAVLVEASRALRKLKRGKNAPELRFVLFDGEEEPAPTDDFYNAGLRGSKAYVAQHSGEVRSMFLLDYVGNKGLQLPREQTSNPALWQQVRRAAARAGVQRYFPANRTGPGILDDHTPFLRAGIPAVDFIDWDYRYKDTLRDTPDKLAVSSLDAVGETIVETLRTQR